AEEGLAPGLNAAQRIGPLDAAVRLYRGDLLPGCEAEWCDVLREALNSRFEDCLRALIAAHKELKQYAQAVHWGRVALAQGNPYEEEYHREIMLCLFLQGNRAGALQQFE